MQRAIYTRPDGIDQILSYMSDKIEEYLRIDQFTLKFEKINKRGVCYYRLVDTGVING